MVLTISHAYACPNHDKDKASSSKASMNGDGSGVAKAPEAREMVAHPSDWVDVISADVRSMSDHTNDPACSSSGMSGNCQAKSVESKVKNDKSSATKINASDQRTMDAGQGQSTYGTVPNPDKAANNSANIQQ
jgi:hypothetical protein